MGELSPWHLAILAGVVVLLFGTKKLPDAARSLGQSMRIFKTEVRGLRDETQPTTPPAAVSAPVTAPVGEPTPAPAPPPAAAAPSGDTVTDRVSRG